MASANPGVRLGLYVAALSLLLLAIGLTRSLVQDRAAFARGSVLDFNVVYCGVRVVLEHGDPYRTEPLRSCERSVEPARTPAWSVTPMPLPGYALLAFGPLGLLPYGVAKVLWMFAVLGSLLVSAWTMARLLRLPFAIVLVLFAPALGVLNFAYGEPVPLAIAALCLGALALESDRPRAAALCTCAALVEPHVGLAALVGLAVLEPRSRATIAAGVVLLGIGSLAFLGVAENVEYVTAFLPAQVAAETVANDQYSLTHVLALIGVPAALASRIGSAQYLAFVAFGVFIAGRVRVAGAQKAAAILVPVVPAMLGGLFVHDVEIAAALPGALLVAMQAGSFAEFGAAGLLLLVFPWSALVWGSKTFEAAMLLAVATGVLVFVRRMPLAQRIALAVALPLACGLAARAAFATAPARGDQSGAPNLPAGNPLSPLVWGMRIRASDGWSREDSTTFLIKVPWWLGLKAVSVAALFARGTRRSG